MERLNNRLPDQMRPVVFTPNYTKNAHASVLAEYGDTKVLCTVCVEDNIPGFLKYSNIPQGWLTAEYSMLPSSTNTRTRRERNHVGGRTQEIQRLIGRSLRGVMDLRKAQDLTFVVDCDVLQADGGTRTTAITGAYIALKMAVDQMMREGKLKANPIMEQVAAISVGIKDDVALVDIDYMEDSKIDLDMNIVMTESGKLLEVQGSGEGKPFTKDQVIEVIDVATEVLKPIFELQIAASEGMQVEG